VEHFNVVQKQLVQVKIDTKGQQIDPKQDEREDSGDVMRIRRATARLTPHLPRLKSKNNALIVQSRTSGF
jgi:hypothetical protein